jgi:hypothetical protein
MAQYLVLIYEDESVYADEAISAEVHAAHTAFFEQHGGAVAGGNALERAATATTIRGNGSGGHIVTDGPFTETKEVLGGYYLIDAPDLDAALEIAKAVPAKFGGVEVRPIRDMS